MVMKFTENSYVNKKAILMFPDHYVAFPQTFAKEASNALVHGVVENGRVIVKAGTLYPANDATAIGVVLSDLDITDGDETGAIVYHGAIKTDKMPVAPTRAAIDALKGSIQFFPIERTVLSGTFDADAKVATINLAGTDFLAAVTTASNLTIGLGTTGLTTGTITKVSAKQITIAFSGTLADGTLEVTAKATAVANALASNKVSFVIDVA